MLLTLVSTARILVFCYQPFLGLWKCKFAGKWRELGWYFKMQMQTVKLSCSTPVHKASILQPIHFRMYRLGHQISWMYSFCSILNETCIAGKSCFSRMIPVDCAAFYPPSRHGTKTDVEGGFSLRWALFCSRFALIYYTLRPFVTLHISHPFTNTRLS